MYTAPLILAVAGLAAAQVATTSEPSLSQIQQAAATVKPSSPTSNVEGIAFKRFIQVWLENIDYSSAAGDPNQQWLASQGITLTNYWAIGHSSEPNYCAVAGGDNYGMDNDNFNQIPANISTIADVLNTKGISWGEYQEHIPYPGFQGFNYSNQVTYANDYVRKHNPLILYDSVAQNASALTQIKGFDSFYEDLANHTLPQWIFITPNMTDDGHDTNVTYASVWEREFISALMNNTYFWNDTLIIISFDESEHYGIQNTVFSVLLGGAVPENLKGTSDDTFYTHYSTLSTVEANWGLPSLGRWDCGANIFEIVSNKTGYTNFDVDISNVYLNVSLDGPMSANSYSNFSAAWPIPATTGKCSAGNGILSSVVSTYGKLNATYDYSAPFPYSESAKNGLGISYSLNGTVYVSGVNSTATNSTTSPSGTASGAAASTSTSAASPNMVSSDFLTTVVVGAVAVFAGLF